jgi:hypothetical protein
MMRTQRRKEYRFTLQPRKASVAAHKLNTTLLKRQKRLSKKQIKRQKNKSHIWTLIQQKTYTKAQLL